MPRKSMRTKPGVRKYGVKSNYTSETLEKALNEIRSGVLTMMGASKKYNIPPATLFYKLKQKHTKSVGRPIALTEAEEESCKSHLLVLSDLGIPINMHDVRVIVKKYLDDTDRKIKQFQNNMPGYEWGTLFLERHPDLKMKVAHNIPRKVKVQVNREQIEAFFANLSKEMEGIPPENVFNMDECGFHGDPRKKQLLFRRDCRHPEIIKNATKPLYTVIFCVNAAGESLPPLLIFKGKALWSHWLFGAPEASRIAYTDSGWTITELFEDWLETLFIPRVSKLEGKKILYCDSFSAHISPKALRLCEQHNIVFICLIPNSTHLLQPLNVSYFSSVNNNWRKVLDEYRRTIKGKKVMVLPKSLFAQFLGKALVMGKDTSADNIKDGFRSCGLFPFSPETVINKFPKPEIDVRESVGEEFHLIVGEFILTRKGSTSLMVGGYRFYLHRNFREKSVWRCAGKTAGCRVLVTTIGLWFQQSTKGHIAKNQPPIITVVDHNPKGGRSQLVGGHYSVKGTKKRGVCKLCSMRGIPDKRSSRMCDVCGVPLCLDPCFKEYHTIATLT